MVFQYVSVMTQNTKWMKQSELYLKYSILQTSQGHWKMELIPIHDMDERMTKNKNALIDMEFFKD